MNALQVIKEALHTSHFVLKAYLADLSEAELMMPPGPEANIVGWQLGHLIVAEYTFLNGIKPNSSPKLPEGFIESHGKGGSATYAKLPVSKDEYIAIYDKQRASTLEVLSQLTEADLDKPGPESSRSYAPKVANVLNMLVIHEAMHSGQIAVLRRKLGKPVVI